jgi:type IV pilus assembly protein PilM
LIDIPFLKKLSLPTFSLGIFSGKPTRTVGIDIGLYSTKVVQLRYEKGRAILETYGELLSENYLKVAEGGTSGGFLRFSDNNVGELLTDALKESNITVKDAILSVPVTSSFVTTVTFPPIPIKEINQSVPFEARKYVPIPISEVILDWEIFEPNEEHSSVDVLLVAVPKEVIEKYKRIAKLANMNLRAVEVETFSLVRALGGHDLIPTAIINLGHQSSTIAIVDRGRLRVSHTINRGSHDLTRALERGLQVNTDRAKAIKHEMGLSEKVEDKEIVSITAPLVEILFTEIERMISLYNRKSPRKIQKINLTGSGSSLQGIVEYTVSKFGVEVVRGNPFSRVVTPAFMQPILREIGPGFSVAVGLALREITT